MFVMDISQHIKNYKIEVKENNLRSERDEYIAKFLERINPDRVRAGYSPLTPARLCSRITKAFAKSDTAVLKLVYQKCESFNDFGKGFNYLTK
jgi:hypothetical protein